MNESEIVSIVFAIVLGTFSLLERVHQSVRDYRVRRYGDHSERKKNKERGCCSSGGASPDSADDE